jgi:hypothetical protein
VCCPDFISFNLFRVHSDCDLLFKRPECDSCTTIANLVCFVKCTVCLDAGTETSLEVLNLKCSSYVVEKILVIMSNS